jgi:hypothetical protein
VGGGTSIACDGDWKRVPHGLECRCLSPGANEPTPIGWTAASAVDSFDARPPLTLATNDGLFEWLGASSARCGIDTAKLRFRPTDSARFVECRGGGIATPLESLRMSGMVSLSVPGCTVEIPGMLDVRRGGAFSFMAASDEKPPLALTAYFENGQAKAIASPFADGPDPRTATFVAPPPRTPCASRGERPDSSGTRGGSSGGCFCP